MKLLSNKDVIFNNKVMICDGSIWVVIFSQIVYFGEISQLVLFDSG